MRKRALFLSLLLAIVGGGAAFVALTQAAAGRATVQQSTSVENVLVPIRSIELGAKISASDVQLTPLLRSLASPDSLHAIDEADGRYAAMPLVPGQPMRRSSVSSSPPGSRLAAIIPEGRVAVSVAVSDVVSISGFITPGDRVDVLGVVTKEPRDDAQVVLRDVLILAVSDALSAEQAKPVDTKASTQNANPQGIDSTITVAVTIQEAQRLVQVDEVGKLRLALRRRDTDVSFSQR